MKRLILFLVLALAVTSCGQQPVPSPVASTPVPATSASLPPQNTVTRPPDVSSTPDLPAPTGTNPPTTLPTSCTATSPDMLGPFYTPGAPLRSRVGSGYILNGVVRSAADCAPISGAVIEFWMAGPDGEYTDETRASLVVGTDGAYQFESPFPPPYSGRPSHIHLRISAPGFNALVTQHYPVEGVSSAAFDLVLVPE